MDGDWLLAPDYWTGRLLLQRLLAVAYLCAFLSTVWQFRPLIGSAGMNPVPKLLTQTRFRQLPSLFHLHYTDRFFAFVCWIGVALAAATIVGLPDLLPAAGSMAVWALMWFGYLSIVNVGQIWYGFVWEVLLLEAGFIAIFLGPASSAPPLLTLLLVCWLLLRLELGAGLIKLRGDKCWRDFTALFFHHETQPIAGPLSWYFHHLPRPLHRMEVAANHFTQLILPFGLFAPRPISTIAAVIIVLTQLWLIASGNFAWLNLVAIALAVSALDNGFLGFVLPFIDPPASLAPPPLWHTILVIVVFVGVAVLSYRPVRNLIGPRQVMNRSYNRFHIASTYGLFGSVTRLRRELVIQGTTDDVLGKNTQWRDYEFRAKPGDVRRRPGQVAPYHLRLDWLMWFAAFSSRHAQPWLKPFLIRLLRNDPATLKLMRHNPFGDQPPKWIRVRLYHYRFTTRAERKATGAWWHRDDRGDFQRPGKLRDTTKS